VDRGGQVGATQLLQAASPERARDAAAGCGPRPGQTGRGAQATGDGTGCRAALRRGLARPVHLGDGGEQGFATVELGRAAARRPGSVARCGSPSGSSVAVLPPRRFLSSALLHGGPAGSSARYSGTGWPGTVACAALTARATPSWTMEMKAPTCLLVDCGSKWLRAGRGWRQQSGAARRAGGLQPR